MLLLGTWNSAKQKYRKFISERNGFRLNVTDSCVISPATGEGAFLPSGRLYMCFYDMKARHKVSLQALDNIDLNQMSH